MKNLFAELSAKGKPFVFYRFPNDKKVFCYYQEDDSAHYTNDFEAAGFVFAPFEAAKTYLYIPDTHKMSVDFVERKPTSSSMNDLPETLKDQFIKQVKKAQEKIAEGKLSKIVLSSRFELEGVSANLDYENLLSLYPSAFVYAFFHPRTGLWMGATPERLFSLSKKTLTTMALAGTLPGNESNSGWSEKEFEEQQMVTDKITAALSSLAPGVPLQIGARQTLQAGALQHLITPIQLKDFSPSIRQVVNALHPTPAVGGLPTHKALHFIGVLETYPRQFYCGFLGPFAQNQTAHFFVNLRCAKQHSGKVVLYAGAGITSQSKPQEEWNEICRKAKTMLHSLHKNT